MAPRKQAEFVIIRLTYVTYINPLYPRMNLTRKKYTPSSSVTEVRDWFDRVMTREKSFLPPNIQINFSEWRIMSGNECIFTVDNMRFDKVMIIMGEDLSYWIFYQNLPMLRRLEGSAMLPVTYCGCCLNLQYLAIVNSVKVCVNKAKRIARARM